MRSGSCVKNESGDGLDAGSAQGTGGVSGVEDPDRQKRVDEVKNHRCGMLWELLEQLRPLAGPWVVLGADPDAGHIQLGEQDGDGRCQSDAGQDFDQRWGFFHGWIFLHDEAWRCL